MCIITCIIQNYSNKMGNYFGFPIAPIATHVVLPNNFGIIQYDNEAFATKYYAMQAEIAVMKKCKRLTRIIRDELYEAANVR